jgi:predicted deacylase
MPPADDVGLRCVGEGSPVAVVLAGVHGDEVVGPLAALRLLDELPRVRRSGCVHVIPVVNPRGVSERVREFGRGGPDLNRLFPQGDGRSDADRRVRAVWSTIERARPDVVFDLHADSRDAVPYAILDRAVAFSGDRRRRLDAALLDLGAATGVLALHDHPDEVYRRFQLERSLAGAVVNTLGVPAITLEIGPRRVADDAAVDRLVGAVLSALAAFGMVDAHLRSPADGRSGQWRRRAGPKSPIDGFFRPEVEPGAGVRTGDVVGSVRALADGRRHSVLASVDGMVVAWAEEAWVREGDVVGTFAVPEGT